MPLIEKKRVLLNIMATYGRAVIVLACGVFSSRWALKILGEVDYGILFGVICGLTVFISFLNNVLATSVGRFFAYAVGEAFKNPQEGLKICRHWFNAALIIHLTISLLLSIIGYPIGVYAIHHWLVIPEECLNASVWAFRFLCVSCFISMVNVPYSAMYTAKQYIAEITLYNLLSSLGNFFVLYYMVTHPGYWFVKYAFSMCFFSILPQICITVRARSIFPECRVVWKYLFEWKYIKNLCVFSAWQFWGCMGVLLRNQGMNILVNRSFGPSVNSANAIANNLAGHSTMLSSSLSCAFYPAITNACGAKQYDLMFKIVNFVNKIGSYLILVLSIPLFVELPGILRIWLVNPPEHTEVLCRYILLLIVIDNLSAGHMIAVSAFGKIASYQFFLSAVCISALPLCWLMIKFGYGVVSIGFSLFITMALCSIGRVIFAKYLIGISFSDWFFHSFMPIVAITFVSGLVSYIYSFNVQFENYFLKLISTAFVSNIILLLLLYFILDRNEKSMLVQLFDKIKQRIFKANKLQSGESA